MTDESNRDDEANGGDAGDPGFLGRGGPAEVLGMGDDEEADEVGEGLTRVDEEDVERPPEAPAS